MTKRFPRLPLMVVLSLGALATFSLPEARSEETFTWAVASTDSSRPHLVQPGSATTFVLRLRNDAEVPRTFRIEAEKDSDYWGLSLARAKTSTFLPEETLPLPSEVVLESEGTILLLLGLHAAEDAGEGQPVTAQAHATCLEQEAVQTVSLSARISTRPKLYLVTIDALGTRYLGLNDRGGLRNPGDGWLTPHTARFLLKESAYTTTARCLMPSATDMNHTAILTGSWPGTTGIYTVKKYYAGLDRDQGTGEWVERWVQPRRAFLQYAKADNPQPGRAYPIRTLFDVAEASANDPAFYTCLVAGKPWMNPLLDDGSGTIDLVVRTDAYGKDPQGRKVLLRSLRPRYLTSVYAYDYLLADPPSDLNAAQDHDGQDPGPEGIHSILNLALAPFEKVDPDIHLKKNLFLFPPDRWITDSAIMILQAEDPDVLYLLLPSVDVVQHGWGAADRPGEWIGGLETPELWDDVNRYNSRANREVTLDVVREADACFGSFLGAVRARGDEGRSIVVFASDHGQVTYLEDAPIEPGEPAECEKRTDCIELSLEAILTAIFAADDGLPSWDQVVEAWFAGGDLAGIFVREGQQGYLPVLEAALENLVRRHPVSGKEVKPLLVINRDEMDAGGVVTGSIPLGGPYLGDGKGELFSELYIRYPAAAPVGETPDRLRWPDLFLFAQYRYQFEIMNTANLGNQIAVDSYIGGHAGASSLAVPIGLRGPGIRKGSFGASANVTLADIAPTLYQLLGYTPPEHVDGRVLHEVLAAP